jgi:hypothetical protein
MKLACGWTKCELLYFTAVQAAQQQGSQFFLMVRTPITSPLSSTLISKIIRPFSLESVIWIRAQNPNANQQGPD